MVVEIFAVPTKLLHLAPGRTYPPTYLVHMPRDNATAAGVAENMKVLQSKGVAVKEVLVEPQAVTPALLQRSRHISANVAAAIVAALTKGGFLHTSGPQAGQLKQDPRETRDAWKPALAPVVGGLSLEPDASPVAELLNLAWAGHELASDPIDAGLAWLEAGGRDAPVRL